MLQNVLSYCEDVLLTPLVKEPGSSVEIFGSKGFYSEVHPTNHLENLTDST